VTKLVTEQPNGIYSDGILSNGNITNYSLEKFRRADLTFAISYDSDIKGKDLILFFK
jgi:small conductance mechanosensitive channel